jgi:23S rRNA (uracil1939-C5)-methyltransferase
MALSRKVIQLQKALYLNLMKREFKQMNEIRTKKKHRKGLGQDAFNTGLNQEAKKPASQTTGRGDKTSSGRKETSSQNRSSEGNRSRWDNNNQAENYEVRSKAQTKYSAGKSQNRSSGDRTQTYEKLYDKTAKVGYRADFKGAAQHPSGRTINSSRVKTDNQLSDKRIGITANDDKVGKELSGFGKRAGNNQGRTHEGKRSFEPKDHSNIITSKKKNTSGLQSCSYLKECGGCRMQQSDYEEHLKEKQKNVEALIGNYCKVDRIIGMKNPYYYRNKVHAVFDHDRKGNPISGVYEEGTHRVIPIDSCLIEDQKADAIIVAIRGLLKSFKIKTYDENTGYGLLRHVLIRKGFTSGEIMVVLVLSSIIFPSKNNFVKALRQLHPEITTIIVNVNDKQTSMILGEKEQVIFGKGFIEDSLCGKVFRISPKSFYQVNSVQTEILYKKAIELAGLTGNETVIDAYCGIGTIGLIASDHVKKVIGVELNKDAVRDAITNAKRNQVTNIEFYNNDAGEFMSGMAIQKETVDVVFLDPPRAGSSEQFLDSLVKLKPKKVVYISCNPVTLERDLEYLKKKGYQAKSAIPVDMFPWTSHVETCCLLYKVK